MSASSSTPAAASSGTQSRPIGGGAHDKVNIILSRLDFPALDTIHTGLLALGSLHDKKQPLSLSDVLSKLNIAGPYRPLALLLPEIVSKILDNQTASISDLPKLNDHLLPGEIPSLDKIELKDIGRLSSARKVSAFSLCRPRSYEPDCVYKLLLWLSFSSAFSTESKPKATPVRPSSPI